MLCVHFNTLLLVLYKTYFEREFPCMRRPEASQAEENIERLIIT